MSNHDCNLKMDEFCSVCICEEIESKDKRLEELEREIVDLIARVIFCIEIIGWDEEGNFTFPDGDIWGRRRTDNAEHNAERAMELFEANRRIAELEAKNQRALDRIIDLECKVGTLLAHNGMLRDSCAELWAVINNKFKRIEKLEDKFGHYHVKAVDGIESPDDSCLKCGLDLRDPIHSQGSGE